MKLKHLELTNKYSIFIDTHGSGFAGGFVLFPAISLYYYKGYFQIGLSLFYKTISITLMDTSIGPQTFKKDRIL